MKDNNDSKLEDIISRKQELDKALESEVDKLRDELKDFVTYDEGKRIRERINFFSAMCYKQKYSANEYIEFMKRNVVTIEVNHPQSENTPYYYTLFSVVTQHITGDTIEELFDKAIDIENSNKKPDMKAGELRERIVYELKKCPHCGGSPRGYYRVPNQFIVDCEPCGIEMNHRSRKEVAHKWNTRISNNNN